MNHPLQIPVKNKLLLKIIYSITKLDALKAIYDGWLVNGNKQAENQGEALLDYSLMDLNITVKLKNEERLNSIPAEGPLVIVANHPLGGLEGMLLAREVLKIRPDLKVLTNNLLLKFPEFEELFIGVDVLNKNKAQSNSKGIRAVSKHLKNEGSLLIFPAGTVSGINLKNGHIEDYPWNDIAGSLIKKYKCACIPFYINAKNSLTFYLSAFIHKKIRTALLFREMLAKKNSTVEVIIGDVIDHKEINAFQSATEITDYLRLCCEVLPSSSKVESIVTDFSKKIKSDVEQNKIIGQLQKLEKYRVLQQGNFSVYCAPYSKLGCVMEQIAICREKTFREVDEGTGKELDSDQFDQYYWHLWAWDNEKNKLVGGYRLGKVDEIIRSHGINNLYSNSLYHYDPKFSKSMEHSIEVGRSFVSLEYQRHGRVLDFLFRGIGAFMIANPEYHTLFGCVSVSKEYSNLAQAFLADSLLKHFTAKPEFLQCVKAKKPLRVENKPWSESTLKALSNVPIINKLLGRIDSGKTIPVLIRHYLNINGRFASFTVNPKFNHSLDGLIVVDMRLTPTKYLERYLGKEGAVEFIKKWEVYESVA